MASESTSGSSVRSNQPAGSADLSQDGLVIEQIFSTPGEHPFDQITWEKRTAKIGGDGGKAAKINYTLDYIGTPVIGSFSPAGLAFVPAPVNTILSTLVIGGVTLTPLFSADNTWLWYTGSVAASSVTMSSTLTGATIVQKVGASVVSQGGAAALSMGLNHLTVQVTVGTEVTTYSIDITRTA